MSAGLPAEGTLASAPRAGDLARTDVPTARIGEPIEDVRRRVAESDWNACVVVNEVGVVFGLLREAELAREGTGPVERFMRPGPSTFRPNVPVEEMATFMAEHELESSPITTNEGRLVGLLRRVDVASAALELHHHHDEEGGAG